MTQRRVSRLLYPGTWFVLGIVFAILFSRIFPLGEDDTRDVEHSVSAQVVIPQVVPADTAMLASLEAGSPCAPLIPDGRWDAVQSKLVVILDGKQQIVSVTSTEAPVVLNTANDVLTCGHPFQVHTKVTGYYMQFNVDNRGPEVVAVPFSSSPVFDGYDYQLAPLTESGSSSMS